MDIKTLREQKHLTQEELAEQTGLSVRTIQRIEAGQEPKDHTAKVLANTLGLNLSSLNDKTSSEELIDYTLVKRINLSSAFVCFITLMNIILPIILGKKYKQRNSLTKGIITLQILWSIVSIMSFFVAGFLKLTFNLHHQTALWVSISLIALNLIIILVNSASIDKNRKLYIKLNFNLI